MQYRKDVFNPILCGGKLSHQYAVDRFTAVENERLSFVRFNQSKLKATSYTGLQDFLMTTSEKVGGAIGRQIILPSTYTGGPRYMLSGYNDAMTICGKYGIPDLFVTFTCDPTNPDILKQIESLRYLGGNDVLQCVLDIHCTNGRENAKVSAWNSTAVYLSKLFQSSTGTSVYFQNLKKGNRPRCLSFTLNSRVEVLVKEVQLEHTPSMLSDLLDLSGICRLNIRLVVITEVVPFDASDSYVGMATDGLNKCQVLIQVTPNFSVDDEVLIKTASIDWTGK